jgi:plasmid stability protein
VRTTVDLPDDLIAEAKARAAREGRTLSEVVADAVRTSFARSSASERRPVVLPTFKGRGLQPGVDLDDTAALLEVMEREG